MNNNLEKAFNTAVNKYFIDIAKQYSCTLKQINEREFHMFSKKYIVRIILSMAHVPDIVITLQPNYKVYRKIGSQVFGIGFIVDALGLKLDLGPEKVNNRMEVFRSIEKQSQALIKCCKKMLEGDFSDWIIFKKMRKERIQRFYTQIEKERKERKRVQKKTGISISDRCK